MPTTQTTQTLELERTYRQSPEQVWNALTDIRALREWFFPGDVPRVKIPTFEAEKGGAYRIEFAHSDAMGQPYIAIGKFTEVVPGKRLVFTWDWEGAPKMPGSVVTIDVAKAPQGTRVTLRHEGLPNQEAAAKHAEGWNGILDRYTLYLNPEANKDVVRRFLLEGAAKANANVVDETVAPDFVWHTPMPGAPPTRDGVKGAIMGFRQAFPDYQLSILHLVGEGDKVVSRVGFTGTNTGPMMGNPPSGRKVNIEFWHIERIANGKIQERWNVMDNAAFMAQLSGK